MTTDSSAGALAVTGLQFAADGYRIEGDAITLAGTGGTSSIRVGDGTAAGAGYTATVASKLTGSNGLLKTDLGTLVLTGDNSYSGGTVVSGGTLQVGNGGASGSIVGDVDVASAGTLAFNRSNRFTFAGVFTGDGAIDKLGNGTLTLTGDSGAFAGTTTVTAGML